jgi:putative Holliday junction resolvase
MTVAAQKFAASLRGRFKKPVFEVDERYTSVEAEAQGAGRAELDAAAATLILEQFFRESSKP